MFKVRFDSKIYDVSFFYIFPEEDILAQIPQEIVDDIEASFTGIMTVCKIAEVSTTDVGTVYKDVVEERAICSIYDMFNKNRGRKLSMARALKVFTKARNVRLIFWNAYFDTRHGKF